MTIRGSLAWTRSAAILAPCVVLLVLCTFDLGRGGRLYSGGLPLEVIDLATLYDSFYDPPPPPPSSWPERARAWLGERWIAERQSRRGLRGAEALLALAAGVVLGRRAWGAGRRRGSAGAGFHVRSLLLLVACAGLAAAAFHLGQRARFFADEGFHIAGLAADQRYNFNNHFNDHFAQYPPNPVPDHLSVADAMWLRRIQALQRRADRYFRAAARPWLAAPPDLE